MACLITLQCNIGSDVNKLDIIVIFTGVTNIWSCGSGGRHALVVGVRATRWLEMVYVDVDVSIILFSFFFMTL